MQSSLIINAGEAGQFKQVNHKKSSKKRVLVCSLLGIAAICGYLYSNQSDAEVIDIESDAFQSLSGISQAKAAKSQYGYGISTLVSIQNTMKAPLLYSNSFNWRGEFHHNGQIGTVPAKGEKGWLHRHPNGSATGSVGSVEYYACKGGECAYFGLGWDTPYTGSNTISCQTGKSQINMYNLADSAERGGQTCKGAPMRLGPYDLNWKCDIVSDDSSPTVQCTASAERRDGDW